MEADIKIKRHLISKQIALNYWPIATTLTTFVAHAFIERGVKFHENLSNGSQYKEKKPLGSPRKVPLITDRSQPQLQRL